MASVLNRATKELKLSANTVEHPVAQWIINPDLSAVTGQPSRYWTITGDAITLMSQAERDAVDTTVLSNSRDTRVDSAIDDLESDLRQVVKLMLSEINILRAQHALPDRTLAQLKNQLRSGYGS